LFIAFAFISVIVPLIEEALKPIGVWFLAGQKLNPTQGFAFGVLCGVGFGLFENLGNTSAGGEMWAVLASTRITTLLLHCLTTGMVGWALASAWTQRRYVRLGITYAVAVVIHGLWNGMAVLSAIGSLEGQVSIKIPTNLQQIGSLATIGIIAMGAFNLVLYLGINTALRNNLGTRALPISGEGATPSFTTGGSAPIEQNHLSTSFNLTTNPSLSSDTLSLPSNEEQHLSTIDTLPKDPESTP
jgi:hypothetical protein